MKTYAKALADKNGIPYALALEAVGFEETEAEETQGLGSFTAEDYLLDLFCPQTPAAAAYEAEYAALQARWDADRARVEAAGGVWF